MARSLILGTLIAAFACSCEGETLKAPSAPASPRGGPYEEPGEEDTGGWGDPKTTRRAGLLRLAQLNVRRYFDTTCDSGKCGAGGYEEAPSAAEFAERTAEIAAGLAKLKADVITLAEVESEACLDAVRVKLREAGLDYPVAQIAETGGAGSVDVAVLSRGKLASVKYNRDANPLTRPDGTRTTFTRELPELHLTFGEHAVIVFAAHFRSKSDDDPGRRLAEAQKATELMVAVGKANPSSLVLLGGDLNDTPGSPPIDAMEAGGLLVRVAKDRPTAAQGTYTFSGQSQAIDHIFTTAAYASAYVPTSATVTRDGTGFAGSDHASIHADFTLSEM